MGYTPPASAAMGGRVSGEGAYSRRRFQSLKYFSWSEERTVAAWEASYLPLTRS